jgi:hypothetical protein
MELAESATGLLADSFRGASSSRATTATTPRGAWRTRSSTGGPRSSPGAAVIVQPLGGAVARLGGRTALGGRDASWALQVVSVWSGPADTAAETAWVRSTREAPRPIADELPFPNFLSGTGDDLVRRAYGADLHSLLVAVKDRWDPHNVFRGNQNIRPSQ